jgi:phosphoribosylaminoimidazole carboxylase/phosphoribosylaminoimidazole-succinocarboxamide synthase
MDSKTADERTAKYPLGKILAEGKTKKVYQIANNPNLVSLVAKDDITAGDGKKHDVIPGKGKWATRTTCNVFCLLQECGVPVAFEEQDSVTSFVAPKCAMLPYEVVVRREAHGSYLKRNPHLKKGQLFPKLLVEFFLKTKNKRWKEHELPCDDPYMLWTPGKISLYEPSKPFDDKPFLVLDEQEVFEEGDKGKEEWKSYGVMEKHARKAFLVLEKAWQLQGRTLVDFKVEFGYAEGMLFLTDVIDNDSWRVLESGAYIDKQVYRDGGALSEVAEKYRQVAELSDNFKLPRQQVIVWRGSESDNVSEITLQLIDHFDDEVPVATCSVHKEPVRAAMLLHDLLQQVPDSVIIAYIGRSNGAGPTLSAMSTVPVITVPASFKEFPDDIYSSLRAPSNVPVMTVIEPKNAALAALNILAAHNPRIYASMREAIEERTMNVMRI